MTRPLVAIAVTGLAISIVSCSMAGAAGLFAAAEERLDWLGWDGDLSRCTNQAGRAGEATTSREIAWDGADHVSVVIPVSMRYRRGAGENVEVRGQAYLLDHVLVGGGTIHLDCNPRGATHLEITLPGRDFESFTVNGSGDIVLEDLDQERIELAINGSGSVRATGTVREAELSIAGSGDADLGDMSTRRIDVSIMGSGDARIAPEDEADIFIAGSGDVDMLTRPARVNSHIAGSGRINDAAP